MPRKAELFIRPTEFTDLRSGEKTLGYRAFDNRCHTTYCNTFDTIPEDDLEVLKETLKTEPDDLMIEMLHTVEEMEASIIVGDTCFDYETIKDILAPWVQ